MYNPIIVRTEKPDDKEFVDEILASSLTIPMHRRITEAARNDRSIYNPLLSLVADQGGLILGFALYFDIQIAVANSTYQAVHMTPIAVPQEYRGLGVGERLARQGMQRCASLGHHTIISMGPYNYFHRFGFLSARVQGFQSDIAKTDDVFLIRSLNDEPVANRRGKVLYPPTILAAHSAQ